MTAPVLLPRGSMAPYGAPRADDSIAIATSARGIFIAKRKLPQEEVAERFETRTAQAFVAAVEAVRRAISQPELEAAVAAGSASEVFRQLAIEQRFDAALRGRGLEPQQFSFQEALRSAYEAGALAELERLRHVAVQKIDAGTVGAVLALDLLNPEAVNWLTTYLFALIRQISAETREAVRDALITGFRDGRTPAQIARTIRSLLGLTVTQTRAVDNFRRALESAQLDRKALTIALSRELRDHRFDATLRAARDGRVSLTAAQIDTMTQRYYERSLKYRSEMIARTETLRASNEGQRELWRQATEQGLLNPARTRRRWVVARDERTCELCRGIATSNAAGVPLGQPFLTPSGPVHAPPVHPHCRCTVVLRFAPVGGKG